MHVGVSAVTGDLTVALGFADGDHMGATGTTGSDRELDSGTNGLKYVSGDLTFNVGVASGTTKTAFWNSRYN